MRYQINHNWYFTQHYTGSLNSMPSEKLEELELVQIPHTVQMLPLRYCSEKDYQMVSAYIKEIDIPKDWEGKCVTLTLEGAAHQAEVYCNGKSAGIHGCGYTAFEVDISELLRYGHTNRIVVKVDSRESLDIPPFGYVIDYMTYGGIYRPVYLEVRENMHFRDVFVMPDDRRHLEAKIEAEGARDCQIRARVLGEEGEVYARLEEQNFQDHFHMHVPRAKLWDTEDPCLYTLQLELVKFGNVMDTAQVRFGFRRIEMKQDGCYLNGKKVKIRGLNRHQSWPYMGYAAPARAQRLDAEILKYELGCNAVRTSHYPQSHAFLDRCDELGLLVFTEIPGWQHIGGEKWKDQAVKNTEDMVRQYRNHPSIFMWGVRINESRDDDDLYRRTVEAAHSLDPSRPTGGVRCLKNSSLLEDVYTYNDFSHTGDNPGCDPKEAVTPDMEKAYFITEYGGHMYPTKAFDDEEHRKEHAMRHVRVLDSAAAHEDIGGTFGWCMFDYNTHKDFGSGDRICYHGVMDMFRNPKLAASVYASCQERWPVLAVSSTMSIGDHPAGQIGEVAVFTNGEKVRLYKNDTLAGEYFPTKKYPHLAHPPVLIGNDPSAAAPVSGQAETDKADANQAGGGRSTGLAGWLRRLYLSVFGEGDKPQVEKEETALQEEEKYMGSWGEETAVWKFEALQGDQVTRTVTVSPVEQIHLEGICDTDVLVDGDTWDMATVRLRAVDQNGNLVPYAHDVLRFETEGCIAICGPAAIALEGGMTGCYIRTIGEEGEGRLCVYRGEEKELTCTFSVKAYRDQL